MNFLLSNTRKKDDHIEKVVHEKSFLTRASGICIFFLLLIISQDLKGQCGVGTSDLYTVNLSAAKDTSWTLSNKSRGGTACVGTTGEDSRCIRFNIIVNPGTDLINFSTGKITGASFYSINCGPLISIGTPACVTGMSSFCISFCKPGGDPDDYIITASSIIKGSDDIILRQNCSGTMSVTGVSAATVNWSSIFPGAANAYNSYLSATSGVTNVTVTPTTGAPAFIDYEVSGTGTCAGLRKDTIRVYTVSPMTVAINPATPALCNGASVTLNATVTGGNPPYVYAWNTGSSATGINVSAIGNYSISVSDNTVGCPNETANVNVIAAPTPAAPDVPPVNICSGSPATITVSSPTGTHEWFTVASGGTAIAVGNNYTTPALVANTTYYVQTTVNGCTSTRTAVSVTVNPIPAAPTATGTIICAGQTASLLASGAGGSSFQWFDAAAGGNLLASTAAYTTTTLTANTTYYVQASNNGCAGPRRAVTVTVNNIPANPTIAGASICSGNSTTLTATAPGGTYQWWDAPTAGSSLGTGIAYNTPVLATTTTYYVQTTLNGCTSAARTAVTVTVNPTPTAPVVNGTSICGGNAASLSVSSSGDTYRWYNAVSGGDLLTTGSSYTTPILNANTDYFISATSATGCTSTRTAATVNVTAIQNPAFIYSAGTYCTTGGVNPAPTIPGGNTGTFAATPAGLVFNNINTGEINVATSTPGLYAITFTTNGACTYSSTVNIRIIAGNADAAFSYSGPFCVFQSNPLPVFTPTSSGGVFSSTAGLNFKNSNSGEIDLTTSLPGTYTVTNSIAGAAGCAGDVEMAVVEIRQNTTANAGINLATCDGQPVSLNGSVGGSATNGSWSIVSGTGSFANASQLSTSFTPSAGQSSVTLQLTSNNPVSPCAVATDIMIVNINSLPVAPTVNPITICSGNAATLIASAPGGTYNWFTSSSGGSLLHTGSVFTTTALTTTTTYFVAATSADNCIGPRVAVVATVNPLPVINSASNGSVCSGIAQNYTIGSSIAGSSFVWSRAAVANITNPVVSGQTTSSITESLQNLLTSAVDVVYQIVPTANGCAGAPFNYTVTVKPIPATPTALTAGPVCVGETIRLSTAQVSGALYNWTGPDGFNATIREPQIPNATALKQGTYAVRVTVDACESSAGNVLQIMKSTPAAPVISNSSPVCVGQNVQLNTAIVLGASYQWTGPNGFVSPLQHPVITNANFGHAGNYSLTITVNGCVGPSSSTAVVVNPLPQAVAISSSGPVCVAEQLRVTADAIPAASYFWTGPNGFVSNDREFIIPSMTNTTTGTYQVIVSVAGCPSLANSVDASLKPTPAAPNIDPVTPVCENEALILNATLVPGATYTWSGPLGFTSNTQSPVVTSVSTGMAGSYSVNIVVDGCRSTNSSVNVVVNTLPAAPVLSSGGAVCVGNTLQLNAATISGASYSWSGPSGFVSTLQNPVIPNAAITNAGIYTAVVSVNGCRGPSGSVTAIVNPLPGIVNISSSGAVCAGRPLQLTADSVTAGVYSWSGPNGFTANTRSIGFAAMNNLNTGLYQVVVAVAGCPGTANTIQTTLKPTPAAPVINTAAPVCENGPLLLRMNTVAGAIYSWSGPSGFTSNAQNPFLDSVRLNQSGIYTANVTVDGCVSNSSAVNIAVMPEPAAPTITSNSPVCVNDQLNFTTNAVTGATYKWMGVNGFMSSLQRPVIAAASINDIGKYGMAVTVNGCISDTSYLDITVDRPAIVNAGTNQVVCANNALVNLAGSISGGTTTGAWSTNGTGRFGTRTTSLNNIYLPGNQDTAAGMVQLTLTSTNNGACRAVLSSITVQITDAPVVDIGNNQVICANDSLLNVNAQFRNAGGIQWTTTGSGLFEAANASNTVYRLSESDKALNNFRILATSTGNGSCIAVTDELVVNLAPVPQVNAGKDVLVFENTPHTLNPTITGTIQSFQWTPAGFLNNALLRNPVFRGNADQLLTLNVVSTNGCVATDDIFITVLKPFPIPNVFSPNGDGIHDTWVIPELDKYPDAEVSVFDRTGKRVFFTNGYKKPWDGRYNGQSLPFATYYYIIIPKIIQGVFSGPVTILK